MAGPAQRGEQMRRSYRTVIPVAAGSLVLAATMGVAAQSPAAPAASMTPATVSLQLQWVPQAQFAGYLAAAAKGFYAEQGLTVNLLPGGPTVDNQTVGSDPNGPEFTVAWVPKVLVLRDQGQSDLVDIAQVFQRSGTREVSWKPGKGPGTAVDQSITTPADFKGKKIGVWDFGDDYEIIAAARKVGLEAGTDYERVIQPFDMSLLLNRQIDAAEAMIYNEYAQVLEATNPDTGALYQPGDLNFIDTNEVGAAMLQDALWAREAWLAQPGNEDIATRFLAASFKGWQYCRDYPDECVQIVLDAGSTLGAGHQAWQLNEINSLVWPSADGIGAMPVDTWAQTVQIAKDAKIMAADPPATAYRTDLAAAARALLTGDTTGRTYVKGTVTVTPKGE
jgi:NitT/TauT family transport system substrate-binding protein